MPGKQGAADHVQVVQVEVGEEVDGVWPVFGGGDASGRGLRIEIESRERGGSGQEGRGVDGWGRRIPGGGGRRRAGRRRSRTSRRARSARRRRPSAAAEEEIPARRSRGEEERVLAFWYRGIRGQD
jgi:hypothetical protein